MLRQVYDRAAAAVLEHAEPLEPEPPEKTRAAYEKLVQHLKDTGQWRYE